MKGFTFIAVIVVLISSCKKPEDRPCFKGVGEETTIEMGLESFSSLFLGPHLNYVLVQDTEEKLVITGGENMVNHVGAVITDGRLSITNDNKCNFLRTYKKSITVEIHLIDIDRIDFEGTKPLTCQNQLNLDQLIVAIKGGAGEFNLNIDSDRLLTSIQNGWGNMVISGTSKYARFNVTSNGFMDSYGLNIEDSVHVISKTPGLTKVNVDNAIFRSETVQSGDIWYVGTPLLIDHNQYGDGELIDKN